MTDATIRRIIRLGNRVLRTRHQVVQHEGLWHYGWGFYGCILDFCTSDNMEPGEGWATEREAAEALAEEVLETLRDYPVDAFREALYN